MEILRILQKKSRYFYFFLVLLGTTNAIWNNALLLLINNKIAGTPVPFFKGYALLLFVLLMIISFIISKFFQTFMLKLTIDLSYEMGISIFHKVRYASYRDFLNYGKEKIYSLMGDIATVSELPHTFIDAFNSAVIFIIGLAYLFSISPLGAAVILFLLTALAVIYYYRTTKIQELVDASRELSDVYNRNMIDLLNGFREVKMSTVRSENLYNWLNRNRLAVKVLNFKTAVKWLNNDLLGRYFWFAVIGFILFGLPHFAALNSRGIAGFIITLLFLMGPIASLIGIIPYYSRIKVAIGKLNQFDLQVDPFELKTTNAGDASCFTSTFENLELRNVGYKYDEVSEKNNFSVFIEKLVISRGELIFITGGNGSGKTTFINLLTGIFRPSSGQIYCNQRLVDDSNCVHYRNMITAIFSDNYMFSENYENYLINEYSRELMEYTDWMKLTGIVNINRQKNKLDIELSKGQQKRVSMIYGLMEKNDILILDEWAADQDPAFRTYFYNCFLPKMKMLGKTVILVTHDEFYYDKADRIIKFESGTIISDSSLREMQSRPQSM